MNAPSARVTGPGIITGLLLGTLCVGGAALLFGRSPSAASEARPASSLADQDELGQRDALQSAIRAAVIQSQRDDKRTPDGTSNGKDDERLDAPVDRLAAADEEPLDTRPTKPLTPAQEAEEHRKRLETSGPAPNDFLIRARALEQQWEAVIAKAGGGMKMSAWRCYGAGCLMTATVAQPNALEELTAKLIEAEGFRDWPGGKFRSGPIAKDNGQAEAVWVLFASPAPSARRE